MSFKEILRVILPPKDGIDPHVTSGYVRNDGHTFHGGIDFNYNVPGQRGINLDHPTVNAPISGTIVRVEGPQVFNRVDIRDSEGNTHEILHMHTKSVTLNQAVSAGDPIGTMGGVGPGGVRAYAQHVHYQMHVGGKLVNPIDWWDGRVEDNKPSAGAGDWAYPFSAANGKTEPSALENIYNRALSRADDGMYPLGSNGLWHGGIHFDTGSEVDLTQAGGIRSIAKGEVVAYRLDREYPVLEYPHPMFHRAAYSSSFVLVRHVLELPKLPQGQTDSSATATPAPVKPLAFFALYMHLLDWSGYEQARTLKRPAYWKGKKHYRVRADPPDIQHFKAPDHESGDVVASSPAPVNDHLNLIGGQNIRPGVNKNPVLGVLPAGTLVEIGETKRNWGRISRIVDGGPIAPPHPNGDPGPGAESGWVYLAQMEAEFEPGPLDQVVNLDKPVRVEAGDLLGHIGEYQNFEQAVGTMPARGRRPLMHMEIFAGEDLPTFIQESRERAEKLPDSTRTLLVIRPGAKLVQASAPDTTIKPADAVVVAKGDDGKGAWKMLARAERKIVERSTLRGFDSKTWRYADGSVLSRILGRRDDDEISLSDYKKLSQAQKAHYSRREVLVSTGEPLWVKRHGFKWPSQQPIPAWTEFPLQLEDASDPEVKWTRVLPRVALERKLAEHKTVEADGTPWWRVTAVTGEGPQEADGWVRAKDHPGVVWQSAWHWPGFETVEESESKLIDFKAGDEWQRGRAHSSEEADFKMRAETAKEGALFRRLHDVLNGDKSGPLTADELRHAYRNPALAQVLTRLIVRYESEWGGPMTKWDELDALALGALPHWQAEKKRIEKLRWWDCVMPVRETYVTVENEQVKDFPKDPEVYHLHPAGLIANFSGAPPSCQEECVVECYELDTSKGKFRVSKQSFEYVLGVEQYAKFPYVPAGRSASGITIAYGYDLGHQREAAVRNDLRGLYTGEEISKFVSVLGQTQQNARSALTTVAHIAISKNDAMTLALRMKKRYAEDVVEVYPQAVGLHPHCQGALLSLVINRGNSLTRPSMESRLEMRQIREDLDSNQPQNIPGRIRGMKRLWENSGQGGLLARRDKEAEFFERGLKCDCWR